MTALRRGIASRLFSSGIQAWLTLLAAGFVFCIVALASGATALWPALVLTGVATALWARGVTAWARVDDDGLHWRYWTRTDLPWRSIHTITLTRRANVWSYVAKGGPIILVHGAKKFEDFVRPAIACGHHRRAFADEVTATARTHGVETEVVSTGWNAEPSRIAEPWE